MPPEAARAAVEFRFSSPEISGKADPLKALGKMRGSSASLGMMTSGMVYQALIVSKIVPRKRLLHEESDRASVGFRTSLWEVPERVGDRGLQRR